MHHPTDRITHTTAFVTPVVEHWLEREIAQWVHPMKDRSDDPPHHERTQNYGESFVISVTKSYLLVDRSRISFLDRHERDREVQTDVVFVSLKWSDRLMSSVFLSVSATRLDLAIPAINYITETLRGQFRKCGEVVHSRQNT